MSRRQHAADDGSFGRSAGAAIGRGVVLIVLAVVLGVVLLRATDATEPFLAVADDDAGQVDDGATEPPDSTSTTASTVAGSETTEVTPPTESTTPDAGTPPSARPPGEVTVLVANGSDPPVAGAAGRLTQALADAGYLTAPAANAPSTATSMVYFTEGYQPEAEALAATLTPPPAVAPMPDPVPVTGGDLRGASILVVQAADLASAG